MTTLPTGILDREWLGKTLGIEVAEVSPERVVLTMPITPAHHQPLGFLHGGASLALAETAASFGGALNCPPGKIVFGLEINANHLRSRRDGTLRAVGTPLHIGQTTQLWDIKIYDQDEKLVCISRCTLAVVPVERESGGA
jgi:1,4-dihydroxy-2-naphthoyl-CoA hydrolase